MTWPPLSMLWVVILNQSAPIHFRSFPRKRESRTIARALAIWGLGPRFRGGERKEASVPFLNPSGRQHSYRLAVEKAADVLHHAVEIGAVVLLGDVAEMRREH